MIRKTILSPGPVLPMLLGLCASALVFTGCSEGYEIGDESSLGELAEDLYAKSWEDLGGTSNDLAVSSTSSNRLDVWGVGTDGKVWHAILTNGVGNGDWENGAGKPANVTLTYVAATQRGSKTDVVATDTTGKIWMRTWSNGSWGTWASVGSSPGVAVGKPAVSAVSSDDRVDVWVRGSDNNLWHSYRIGTGGWSAWGSEGTPTGGLTSAPAVVTRQASPLVLDVVARGTNNALWHRAWANNAWQAWESLNGATGADPTIASSSSTQLTVLARGTGTDQSIYQTTWAGSGWSSFTSFASPSSGSTNGPSAVYTGSQLEVVIRGTSTTKNAWRRSQLRDLPQAMTITGLVGKCVDMNPSIVTPSGNPKAILKTCNGSTSQSWQRIGSTYKNVLYGKCLNVEGAATANNSPVVAYTCSTTPLANEKWDIAASGGVSQLIGNGSQKCLNVPNANRADNTGLVIYACTGLPNDRWYPGDGTSERIRLKVFAMADSNGAHATTVTINDMNTLLTQVNSIYRRGGVSFEIAQQDWVLRNDSLLNGIQDGATTQQDQAARALAAQNQGYLTILLTNGPGGFSGLSSTSDYAKMPGSGIDLGVLAHELGHYFGLPHTMYEALYQDCGTGNDCYNSVAWNSLAVNSYDPELAYNADGIQDTPPDPGPWVFERRAGLAANPPVLPGIPFNSCGGADSISITDPATTNPHPPVTVTPDRANLMSYFGCAAVTQRSVTPQQLAKVRTTLFGSFRKHLVERVQ